MTRLLAEDRWMHVCEECGASMDEHHEVCWFGRRHFPALCCPGCGCGSFEEAHPESRLLAEEGT